MKENEIPYNSNFVYLNSQFIHKVFFFKVIYCICFDEIELYRKYHQIGYSRLCMLISKKHSTFKAHCVGISAFQDFPAVSLLFWLVF